MEQRVNLYVRDSEDVAEFRKERAEKSVSLNEAERRADEVQRLSLGNQQRVQLAAALVAERDVLVLDEPSTHLDPVARRELADVLLGLDRTMLMVTHDLPYALQLCPRSVVIDGGVVVADAPTRDLLADADFLAAHRLELPFGFALG